MKKEIKNEEKKNKHSKLKSVLLYAGTFLALFGVSGAATYFLIPSGVTKGDAAGGDNGGSTSSSLPNHGGSTDEQTPTERFVANLAATAPNGIEGTVGGTFTIPSTSTLATKQDNVISINKATFKFQMPSLDELAFSLNAPVDYNGRKRQLDVTYSSHKLYFGISYLSDGNGDTNNPTVNYDVKYYLDLTPTTYTGKDGKTYTYNMGDLDYISATLTNCLASPDEGGVTVSDSSSSSSSLSSIDTNALLTTLGSMPSWNTENGYGYYLNLTKDLIGIDLPINLYSDSNFDLTGVLLPGYDGSKSQTAPSAITLDNGMSFGVNFACEQKVVSISAPTNATSYHRLSNSLDLFTKLGTIVQSKEFSLSSEGLTSGEEFSLSHVVTAADAANGVAEVSETSSLDISAAVNLQKDNDPSIHAGLKLNAKEGENTLSKSILVDYLDGGAYLNYNDVLKASMGKTVLDELITKVKDDSGNTTSDTAKTSAQLDKMFGFITQSKLITAIKEGHYEPALDMITDITGVDNNLSVTIDLSPIGLSGQVILALDGTGTNDNPSPLASISFKKVVLKSFTINGKINITDYSSPVAVTASDYAELSHLPTIYDQVYALAQDKKASVSLSGSVMSDTVSSTDASQKIGFTFSGNTDFDVSQDTASDSTAKSGSGRITIKNYTDTYCQDYKVGIDVVGVDEMYFDYNDYEAHSYVGSDVNHTDDGSKKLVGSFTIDTLNDIIDLVSKLVNSNDARFTKFGDMITETAATTIVSSLAKKEFNSLITNKIIVSSSISDSEASLVISKALIGTGSDFKVSVNYDGGKIKSLSVSELVVSGKTINCKISLDAYGDDFNGITQQVATSERTNAWNFSQIEILMQYGINAAVLGTDSTNTVSTYHLTASGSGKVMRIGLDVLTMDFYVYVDGANVKLMGYVELPILTGLNSQTFNWTAKDIFGVKHNYSATPTTGTRRTNFYYEASKTDMDGVLYMTRTDTFSSWGIYTLFHPSVDELPTPAIKKVTGSDFLANMSDWLFQYVLGLESSVMNKITSSSSSTSQPTYVEDVLTGFNYDDTNSKWTIDMDLGALAHTDMLKGLDVTITGQKDFNSASTGTTGILRYLTVSLTANIGINIYVNLNAELSNFDSSGNYVECWSSVNDSFRSYVDAHASDAYSTSYKAY
jgi:hypothetical protein